MESRLLIQPVNARSSILRSAKTCFLMGAIVIFAQPALAQNYPTTVPTDILAQYKTARLLWTTNIWVYANALFGLLAVIEFAWSAAVMLLEKADLQSWTAALVRKIMWIGAFYMLLLNGRIWIPAIIDSFNQIGAGAAGFGVTLSPGDIFSQGLTIAAALVDAATGAGFLTNPGTSLSMALSALLVVIAYIVITLNFVVTVVESYLVVSVGFIFLGFGGSRWTVPYLERYIGLAVSIGIKIILLYCLISAGLGLGNGWLAEAQGIGTAPHPSMTAFDVMGAALIFMMLCWQIPKLFAAVLGGAPALTGGDLVSTGIMVASAGLAVSSAAAAGVGAIAGGAAALSGTGSAASAGSTGSNGIGAIAGSNSASSGTGGSVSPPSNTKGGATIGSAVRQQPNPPSTNSGGVTLASLGGEALAGSGFEDEPPSRGFRPNTSEPPASGETVSDKVGGASAPTSQQINPPRENGGRSPGNRFQRFRRGFPAIPSDAAPHATPPRMPIDHQD
jgi:type IV secretion system protein TrbL